MNILFKTDEKKDEQKKINTSTPLTSKKCVSWLQKVREGLHKDLTVIQTSFEIEASFY